MQAAVAVAEGWVAAVMRRLYVVVAVLGLLVWVVLEVQVSVELVAEAAVLVLVVVMGPSIEAHLGVEGGGGDHRRRTRGRAWRSRRA